MPKTNIQPMPPLVAEDSSINESIFSAVCSLIMDAETYARTRRKRWSRERVLAFGALIGELDDWHNELAAALIAAKRGATIFVINRGLTQAQRNELPIHIQVMAAKMMHQSLMCLCQRYNQAISNHPRSIVAIKLSSRRFLRTLGRYYSDRYMNLRCMNTCPNCGTDLVETKAPKLSAPALAGGSIVAGIFC